MMQAGTLALHWRGPRYERNVWNFYECAACQHPERPTCPRAIATFCKLQKEYRVMISIKTYRVLLLALACAIVFTAASSVFCQDQSSSSRAAIRDDDTNLETQLYLILATNREIDEGKIPAALDPIMKRLRESLPFKHYSVAGTFLNRVKNNGRLDGSWVGSPFLLSSASSAAALSNPSFNQFAAVV